MLCDVVCVANVIICSVLLDYVIAPGKSLLYSVHIVTQIPKIDDFGIDDLTFQRNDDDNDDEKRHFHLIYYRLETKVTLFSFSLDYYH